MKTVHFYQPVTRTIHGDAYAIAYLDISELQLCPPGSSVPLTKHTHHDARVYHLLPEDKFVAFHHEVWAAAEAVIGAPLRDQVNRFSSDAMRAKRLHAEERRARERVEFAQASWWRQPWYCRVWQALKGNSNAEGN